MRGCDSSMSVEENASLIKVRMPGSLNILPIHNLKKFIQIGIANGYYLIAYKNATAFNAVNFINGYDVRFMSPDTGVLAFEFYF